MDLDAKVSNVPLVGGVYARRLEKLGIETVSDLLHHVPRRYVDYSLVSSIARCQPGETVTILGGVNAIKNIYAKGGRKIQKASVSDKTGSIDVVWFNQPFLVRNIKVGNLIYLSGKVDWFDRRKAFISPEYEAAREGVKPIHTGRLVPIYPETAGISSKWLRSRISKAIELFSDSLREFLPQSLLSENSFQNFKNAISLVHFPESLEEGKSARHRLSFDELLFHQLKSLYRKKEWHKNKPFHKLKLDKKTQSSFLASLPFELTGSQIRSVKQIFADLSGDSPMNRLLEGDVGSGKTVVAASAAFLTFVNGVNSVFMAPTQILAEQHFATLRQIFEPFKVRVSLTTGAGVKSDLGKSDIYVGTHALIHKKIAFENVALVVIDEQHRFGVEQRAHLIKKVGKTNFAPHVLTMTATPIPRTVALTVYGDLDLSTLDELPKGRIPITTWLVPPQKREKAYEWIKQQIKSKNIQVFVICPLIEESNVETMKQVKAATQEFEKLSSFYSEFTVDLLHGRQKAGVKNEVLKKFKEGKTHILVSTPVVEVGIDVANASIMLIEGADRFGLAQLHQLRGRIGRGSQKSYCLCFTETRSPRVFARLTALRKSLSGFELAELDLQIRGPGEMFGVRQHGYPDLKIASWSDTELIKKARAVAQDAIEKPAKYAALLDQIRSKNISPN